MARVSPICEPRLVKLERLSKMALRTSMSRASGTVASSRCRASRRRALPE
jgi:hypothetical protein